MKTRIISGVVAAAVLAVVLWLNYYFNMISVIAVAVLAAVAMWEMLKNTGCITNKAAVIVAMTFAALSQFSYSGDFILPEILSVVYVLAVIAFAIFNHKNFGDRQITMMIAMPIAISFAFACLVQLINTPNGLGLFYFVMVFNFACVSDICAYFVGSAVGKHKLAPEISPKKTIEGAVGGLVGSTLCTLLICIVFELILKEDIKIITLMIATPFLSAIGMLGDLFASAIKRNYGIKDYGNIMPGHGGVLDRTDSILVVAPAFALLISLADVVK